MLSDNIESCISWFCRMARLEGHKSSGYPIWDEWMRIMDEERANKSDSSKDDVCLSGESSDSNTSVIQDA